MTSTNKQFKDKDGNDITDANAVHKTGAETIAGVKTFTNTACVEVTAGVSALLKKATGTDITVTPTTSYPMVMVKVVDTNGADIGYLQFKKLVNGKTQLEIRLRNVDGTLKNIILAESD